jgi:hypothetical protein
MSVAAPSTRKMSDFVVSRVVMDTLEKVKKNSVLAEK